MDLVLLLKKNVWNCIWAHYGTIYSTDKIMIILLLMKIMKLIIIISCMTIQLCVCNKVFISQMFLSWNYFVFDLSLIIFLQIYLNDINIFNIISCFLYLVVMHAYGWLSKILSCIFSWIDIRKYKCEWIWYDRKKLCFESTPNGLQCRIGMLILFWINKVFATDAVSQGQEKERREVDSLNIW